MKEFEALKIALIEHLERHDEKDKPFMFSGGIMYSINDLIQEVKDNTHVATDLMRSMIILTIDLLKRNKISNNPK